MIQTRKLIFILAFVCLATSLHANEHPCPWIKDYIVLVPDFPKPGITFRRYHSVLRDPKAFQAIIHAFADRYRDMHPDVIVGLDSRGFIFGGALAYELGVPFVMIRKAGKLPGKVDSINYDLHYGKDAFEIESDSIKPGDRVIVIDDTLATGGTSYAACKLLEQKQAVILEVAFMMELAFLNGRSKLDYPVFSLVSLD